MENNVIYEFTKQDGKYAYEFTKQDGKYATLKKIDTTRIDLLNYEYIAQDKNCAIYLYSKEPKQLLEGGYWYKNDFSDIQLCILPKKFFQEISYWENLKFNIHEDKWDINSEGILIGEKSIGIKLPIELYEDFNWIAQDQDGNVFVYEHQPYMYHDDIQWSYNEIDGMTNKIYNNAEKITIEDWRQRIFKITESNGSNFYINKAGELIEA